MKTNLFLKRFVAYFIDYIIITFIATGLVYLTFINPKYEEYKNVSSKYSEIVNSYYSKEITTNELQDKAQEISYELNKTGYVYTIGNIVIALLYFGVFAYFTKGQTLGKKIMNIKIVSAKDKDLKLYNYLIRTFILNGIILNIICLIAICFKESTYLIIYSFGSKFDSILMIAILACMLANKEGRGLHDLIAGTKVIDLKAVDTEEVKEVEIKNIDEEVQVIKPKKNTKKEDK